MKSAALALLLCCACGRLFFDETTRSDGSTTDLGDALDGPSLVAHYPLDVGCQDVTPNGLHGTCSGMECPTTSVGRIGMAMEFDGSSQFCQIDDDPRLHMQAFTIAIWIYPMRATMFETPVVKTLASGAGGSFELAIGSMFNIFCTTDATDESCLEAPPPQAPQDVWTHVAMTWDGMTKRIYENGVETATEVHTTTYDTSPMYIGRDVENGVPRGYWPGRIDELRIYNRELAAAEIGALYNTP